MIVTGGAGFIGSHLVSELLRSGFETTVVDLIARPRQYQVSGRLRYHRMDAYNIGRLGSKSMRNARIVHLAAMTSVERSLQDPVSTIKSNIGAICATLEFARKLDSDRFVFASTAAVYGDHGGPCRETDMASPLSPYAVSKLASEYYCKIYSRLYGIPTVILRYFNVYGPRQSTNYAGVITRFVRLALQGRPPIIFGDGKQTRDFVFVEDVVTATIDSLSKPMPGGSVINVGTGIPISINSLADRILRILKAKHLRPVHTSPRLGEVRHSRANISAARRKIGFEPRYNLDKGLRVAIDWFREVS